MTALDCVTALLLLAMPMLLPTVQAQRQTIPDAIAWRDELMVAPDADASSCGATMVLSLRPVLSRVVAIVTLPVTHGPPEG